MLRQTRRQHGHALRLRRAASLALSLVAVVSLLLLGACTILPQQACGQSHEGPPSAPNFEAVTAPVEANGVVYIGYQAFAGNSQDSVGDGLASQNRLAAFRASDGRLLWQRPLSPAGTLAWRLDDPVDGPTLALAGDHILLLSNNSFHTLAALRTSDGTLLWQLPRSVSPRASPVVQDGILYTFDDDGLYAVRLSDGQVLWSVPPPIPQDSAPLMPVALDGLRVFGPVVAAGVVYVGWLNGPVVAVRASDGTPLWQVVPPVAGPQHFTQPDPVAVVGGVLYVRMDGEYAQTVLLVRTRDGHVMGHIQSPSIGGSGTPTPGTPGAAATPGTPATPSTPGTAGTAGSAGEVVGYFFDPVVIGGTLYLGASEVTRGAPGQLGPGPVTYSLQTVDGRRLWQVPLTTAPAHVVGADDGVVFLVVARAKAFMAVRMADGVVLWRRILDVVGGPDFMLTAAGDGALYVSHIGQLGGCDLSQHPAPALQAWDASDGHVVWTRTFPITGS